MAKKTGEAPAVYDSLDVRISKDNIVQYYKNLGYFNVEVESEIEKLNKRNLAVKYIVKPKQRYLIDSILSGVLFHGLYLGGVFYSISIGMPTSLAALIVTLQPVLTNILSGPVLNEKITLKQWIGGLLGFVGALLVLGIDIGSGIPILGLVATLIALLSITFSTIWQKKLSTNLPLSVNNFYQSIGGCLFHILIIIFLLIRILTLIKHFC